MKISWSLLPVRPFECISPQTVVLFHSLDAILGILIAIRWAISIVMRSVKTNPIYASLNFQVLG